MTLPAAVRINVPISFPAQVVGVAGIGITKANGIYTIKSAYDSLVALGSIVPSTKQVKIFDPVTGIYNVLTVAALLAGPYAGVSIIPTSGTLNQGLTITQVGPATGTPAGPIDLNRIAMTFTSGVSGAGFTDGAINAAMHGLRVDLTVGGPNLGGPVAAGFFHLHQTIAGTSTGPDKIALTSLAYRNVADTGGGGLFGGAFMSFMDTGASGQLACGSEIDIGVKNGVAAPWRLGLNITNMSTGQAGTLDAAIGITNTPSTGSAGGSFKKLIALSNIYGLAPLDVAADLFYADTAYTVANGFNLPAMTITGNFVNLPNIGITGGGKAIFGGAIASLNPLANFEVTAPSSGQVDILVSTNTVTGFSAVSVLNSTSAVEVDVIANESNRTATHFGRVTGNYGEIVATSPNGLLFGTAGAVPIVFGTNTAFAGAITGGQQWYFGTDHTPATGTLLTLSRNAASPPAAVTASALLQAVAADGVGPVILIDSFGTGNIQPFIVARRARGTAGAFTATQLNDALGYFGMVGATGANTFASETAAAGTSGGVFFGAIATENWAAGAMGCELRLYSTPNTTAAIVLGATLKNSGCFAIGTATDTGVNSLSAADVYTANVAFVIRTKATLNNAAAANTATLTNAPAAGNPTKWISFDDNGTTRRIPAW